MIDTSPLFHSKHEVECNENQSKGIAYTIKNDSVAISRFSSRFVTHDYINRKRTYSPSFMLAYRMAEVFGVSVEVLCCLKENKELEDKEYENL